jgi:hypothetical protein
MVEHLVEFIALPRINVRGRVGVHGGTNKRWLAAGQASWLSVTGTICAGNAYITTQIPYADFSAQFLEKFSLKIFRGFFSVSIKF